VVSERCAKTREIRASRNSSSRNVARFSIEILDPRERDLRKFSLPIHLFANAKLKKEKERERKKRKGRRKNTRYTRTFQRRFDVVHGQQLSLFIRR